MDGLPQEIFLCVQLIYCLNIIRVILRIIYNIKPDCLWVYNGHLDKTHISKEYISARLLSSYFLDNQAYQVYT